MIAEESPKCGHSACRQNWIDTGETACICCPYCEEPELNIHLPGCPAIGDCEITDSQTYKML